MNRRSLFNIQDLEPDHANLLADMGGEKKKVKLGWNKLLIEFEKEKTKLPVNLLNQ